jgi:molybdopterin-guanine dinucleotide biosynthesis protein A
VYPDLSIAILIGGRSSRFGSNKLIHTIQDKPIALHVLSAAQALSDSICFVSRPESEANELLSRYGEVIFDQEGFVGPLAGVCAALHWSKRASVLVLAGDIPRVTGDVLRRIVEARSNPRGSLTNAAQVVAPSVDGVLQPLCAVYATALAPRCLQLLQQGRRAAHSLFDVVDGVRVDAASLGEREDVALMLRGVNTKEELSTIAG